MVCAQGDDRATQNLVHAGAGTPFLEPAIAFERVVAALPVEFNQALRTKSSGFQFRLHLLPAIFRATFYSAASYLFLVARKKISFHFSSLFLNSLDFVPHTFSIRQRISPRTTPEVQTRRGKLSFYRCFWKWCC